MSKKKSRRQSKQTAQPRSRRKLTALIALIMILATSGVIIAQRTQLWAVMTGATSPSASPAPPTLDPASPSKEYVYAGGRLIATEEQQAAGCSYSINPTSQTFAASGGSNTVGVSAGAGCAWTAASNDSWITITAGASGSGAGTVSYSVDANTLAIPRTGTMTIAELTFTVSQDAAGGCTYSISPTSISPGAGSGSGTVNVSAGQGCSWTAASNVGWITIDSGASGAGNGTVSFSVATNPLTTPRTGTMTIAGQTFTVNQSGNSCSYSLLPTSASFTASGGSNTVNVSAGAGCAWTAVSNAAWVTITSGASGSGNGALDYTVAANPTTSSRQGTMTIAGLTFTVDQAPNCNYTIMPASQNFIAAGGTGQISVTTPAECSWTASPSDSWIMITSGAGGTGNVTINYTVSVNTGPARTGSITVNGQVCLISQDTGCTYEISPTSQSFPSTGGNGTIAVTTNSANCPRTATTTDSWITITGGASGTGNGNVTFTVANNSGASRTGTITIAGETLPGQTFTVTQAGSGGVCQVSTFAGNGSASYGEGTGTSSKWNSPNSSVIAKHPQTSLYALFIADTENHRIRMIYLEGPNVGLSSLIAGSGVAGYLEGTGATARFNNPRGIAAITNASGVVTTLLVADTSNHCIRKLTYSGGSWTSAIFSGKGGTSGYIDGAPTTSRFNSPQGMIVSPDTFIYVADTGNAKVRKLTSTGTSSTLAVTGGLNTSVGITVGGAGNLLYISDVVRHSIWQVNPSTAAGTKLAGADVAGFADGTGTAARFNYPAHLAFASTGGDTVFVADRTNNRIRKLVVASTAVTTYAGTGTAGYADGSCAAAQFNLPYGVAYGLTGELYILDTENNRIRKAQ